MGAKQRELLSSIVSLTKAVQLKGLSFVIFVISSSAFTLFGSTLPFSMDRKIIKSNIPLIYELFAQEEVRFKNYRVQVCVLRELVCCVEIILHIAKYKKIL